MVSSTFLRVSLLGAAIALTSSLHPASAQGHGSLHDADADEHADAAGQTQTCGHTGQKKPAKSPKPAGGSTAHPSAVPKPSATPPMDHAAMGHDMPMPTSTDPAMPPMEGMAMPASDAPAPPMDHSAMPMPMDHAAMPGMSMAPTEPLTPIPMLTDADRAAAVAPAGGHTAHDNTIQSFTLIDRLETWNTDQAAVWNGRPGLDRHRSQSSVAAQRRRTHRRSHGKRELGSVVRAQCVPWWDVVAECATTSRPAARRISAIGVMGLAPYKFEVAATAYLGSSGQTAARIEAEYETLLTNRLIQQP